MHIEVAQCKGFWLQGQQVELEREPTGLCSCEETLTCLIAQRGWGTADPSLGVKGAILPVLGFVAEPERSCQEDDPDGDLTRAGSRGSLVSKSLPTTRGVECGRRWASQVDGREPNMILAPLDIDARVSWESAPSDGGCHGGPMHPQTLTGSRQGAQAL